MSEWAALVFSMVWVAPTHLLMDLAGVLAVFDRQPRLVALGRLCGLSSGEVAARVYSSGFVEAADSGEFDADGVRAGISGRLGLRCAPEEVDAAWMAAFQEDPAALAVMDAARPACGGGAVQQQRRAGGVVGGPVFARVAARCDAIVFAGVLGVRKPAEQAYTRALQTLGVAAERCLFVDDNPDNVEAGRAAGIDSVLYTSPAQLHRELAARGALP